MIDGNLTACAMQWNSAMDGNLKYKLRKNTKNQGFKLLICNQLEHLRSTGIV
jgi:hypothetical protein